MMLGCVYLFVFWLDPFIISFLYEPLDSIVMRRLQWGSTIILVLNMFIVPFTGVPKKQRSLIEEDSKKKKKARKLNKETDRSDQKANY